MAVARALGEEKHNLIPDTSVFLCTAGDALYLYT